MRTELLDEAARARAITILRDRYASGATTLEEFSTAVEAVLCADGVDAVRAVVPESTHPAPASHVAFGDAAPLQEQLVPGEELLWVGRPRAHVHLSREDWLLLPVALSGVAVAAIFLMAAMYTGAVVFGVFAALFALMAFHMSFGRFALRARRNRRTLYGVSTDRVISVVAARSGSAIDSVHLRALPRVAVHTGRDGRGTVSFGDVAAARPDAAAALRQRNHPAGAKEPGLGFADVPDAAAVAQLVRSLQAHIA